MAAPKVRWFRWDLAGAPEMLYDTPGSLISVLDACLVNGFNANGVDQLSYDSVTGKVTATVNAGHGFVVGQVVRVEGADQAEYNGDFEVLEVLSPTQFTYQPSTAPTVTPATGTITVKAAPLGWSKPFAGTNKAVYRPPAGLQPYLRVQDDLGDYQEAANFKAFDSMTDVDTGINWWGDRWIKRTSAYGYSTINDWILVGDDRRLYISVKERGDFNHSIAAFFGDIITFRPGDAGHHLVLAEPQYSGSDLRGYYGDLTDVGAGSLYPGVLYKDYAQAVIGREAYTWSRHYNSIVSPNPVDNADHIVQAGEVLEINPNNTTQRYLRGRLPGLYGCICGRNPAHGTIFQVGSRRFIAAEGHSGNIAIEISTDWPV